MSCNSKEGSRLLQDNADTFCEFYESNDPNSLHGQQQGAVLLDQDATPRYQSNQMQQYQDGIAHQHQPLRTPFVPGMAASRYSASQMGINNIASPENIHQVQSQQRQVAAQHRLMQTSQPGQVQQSPSSNSAPAYHPYKSPYGNKHNQLQSPPKSSPWAEASATRYKTAQAIPESPQYPHQGSYRTTQTQPMQYHQQCHTSQGSSRMTSAQVTAHKPVAHQGYAPPPQPTAVHGPVQAMVHQPVSHHSYSHPPQPNAVYAPTQAYQGGRLQYHPAIIQPKPDPVKQAPAAPRKFSSKADYRELLQTRPLPNQPVTTLTSHPGFLPTHVHADGKPVNLKSERQTLAKARGLGGVAASNQCMICKVEFGHENPHGAHGENIKVPGGMQWIDINNTGAVEVAVRLPCGHVAGNNCIVPYYYCPRCHGQLTFSACGHKVPLRPTDPTTTSAKVDLPAKCTQCGVFEVEQNGKLLALLSEMAKLKMQHQLLSGASSEESHWKRYNVEVAMRQTQGKIAAIEADTNDLIQEAQFGGYY